MDYSVLLLVLLALEVLARVCLEVRERRATQLRGGPFAVLRVIPLINDIVPLPEGRGSFEAPGSERAAGENVAGAAPGAEFVEEHEKAHKVLRHGILRNLLKVILLSLAVGLLLFLLVRCQMLWWQAVVGLHLVAVLVRLFFHWYCWNQEYEADRTAFDKVGKKTARDAMRNLAACEIPYTPLFALVYREHPTVSLRSQRLLNKQVGAAS